MVTLRETLAPWTPPCLVCDKCVLDNQDGLFCEVCLNWAHRLCVKMSESEYYHWANIEDGWICPKCEKESFPYHDVSTLSTDTHYLSSGVTDSSVPQISQCSTSHCNLPFSSLKLLSTNVRSLLPKIDDLRGLCSHEHFDIIVATETWLSNAILDSKVHIQGYNLIRIEIDMEVVLPSTSPPPCPSNSSNFRTMIWNFY